MSDVADNGFKVTEYVGYSELLLELKNRIRTAQVKAAVSVNKGLIRLYWDIGCRIIEKQTEASWGDGFLRLLSDDLRLAFPGVKGFSVTNLKYMRLFAQTYRQFGPQAVDQIPWGHNRLLINRLDEYEQRIWYAKKTVENGWSRSILEIHLDNDLYGREGKALSNFEATLPSPQSQLAQQVTRDPYCFDFLTLREDFIEKELEHGLSNHIKKMLTALGSGFAYVGNQYHLEVGGKDYYIDMMLYHLKLHCYCVVELKATEFKPEYVGKLNFYLSAVDDLVREPEDKPTIGMLLCKGKDSFTVEYSLRDLRKPVGVSSYTVKTLQDGFEASLPSREELAARLDRDFLTAERVCQG